METFTPTVTFTDWKQTDIPKLLGLTADCIAIDEGRLPALLPVGGNVHYTSYGRWRTGRIAVLSAGGFALLFAWARLFSSLKASNLSQGIGFFGLPASTFIAHEACEARGRQELRLFAADLRDIYHHEVGVVTDALTEMGDDAFKMAIQRVQTSLVDLFEDKVTARTLTLALITMPIPTTQPTTGSFILKRNAEALLDQ